MNDSTSSHSPSEPVTPVSEAIEAATLRRLLAHLEQRTDVQNIDLMNLAGFCRNCLSKWYRAEAETRGVTLSDAEARTRIYGMPYEQWKSRFQTEASPEALARFQRAPTGHE